MTVVYRKGDVTRAPAYAHGCNCRGVMGAGVAVRVRLDHPAVYEDYVERCRTGRFALGDAVHYFDDGQHVINLATQDEPGPHATETAIHRSLSAAIEVCERIGIRQLAIPWVGCGIGGLDRDDVRPILELVAAAHPAVRLVVVEYSTETPVVALHTPCAPTGEQLGPHEITVDGVIVGLTNHSKVARWLHDELLRDEDFAREMRDGFEMTRDVRDGFAQMGL